MVCGDVCTGSEWVRCTELRLWLGMLLLPPGLANHRFCVGRRTTRFMASIQPSYKHLHTAYGVFKPSPFHRHSSSFNNESLAHNVRSAAWWVVDHNAKRAPFHFILVWYSVQRFARGGRWADKAPCSLAEGTSRYPLINLNF